MQLYVDVCKGIDLMLIKIMMVVNAIRIEDHRTREYNNDADEFKNSIISSMLNVLLFDRGIKYEFLH